LQKKKTIKLLLEENKFIPREEVMDVERGQGFVKLKREVRKRNKFCEVEAGGEKEKQIVEKCYKV